MAKVFGPLHSDDARGKLADSMVFMGWRGLKTVRMYKIPANPNTEAQQTQRANFTSGVADFHTLNAADVAAWSLRASGSAFSGYNLYVKKFVDTKVVGKTWNTISSVSATPIVAGLTIHYALQIASSARVRLGTTRGTWTLQKVKTTAATTGHIKVTGLTASTQYFYIVDSLKTSIPSESGHYSVTTG